MKTPVVFLWYTGIDDVLLGTNNVTGIQVQMCFWAKVFVKHGWKVYSLTNHENRIIDGIEFIEKKTTWLDNHGFSILQEFIDTRKNFKRTTPDIVVVRGARRVLYAINKACNAVRAKLVFMGASDKDFEPGKELIIGSSLNKKLYHKAIRDIGHFVTQNQQQADNLFKYYGKRSITIPNIWISSTTKKWFLNLAKQMPQYRFAIVGGVNEQDYYDKIKAEVEYIPNLDFLGPQSLYAVNALLSKSKLLVCTSEFEGFPNTFLQAWSESVPVISTVNPSGVITEFGLGKVIDNELDLYGATTTLLTSEDLYKQCQQNIKDYFLAHHDAERAYCKMMDLVNQNNLK